MMVLVNGGVGYIGTSLIPQPLYKGYKVHVLDNLTFGRDQLLPFFYNNNFTFQKSNIRNIQGVKEVVRGVDAIVHLAAILDLPTFRKDPKDAVDINVTGLKKCKVRYSLCRSRRR